MYRSFLSWRYLVSRPTNLIGICGILVGVGALILILSIMTGFLEESRRTVRGTLSDVIVNPLQGESANGRTISAHPGELLTALRADERVAAATAQLAWAGVITQRDDPEMFQRILADQNNSQLLGAQIVGIDVRGLERLAQPAFAALARSMGGFWPAQPIQDELDASAFLYSLQGDEPGEPWTVAAPNPLFPFASLKSAGSARPKAGVLIGEQLFNQLRMRVGQELELGTVVWDPARDDWQMNNRKFVITGTFRTRDNETDNGRIYLDRRELADFLGQSRRYTQVLVSLKDYERDGARFTLDMRKELAERGLIAAGEDHFGGRQEVRTWEEFRGNLLGAIENERVLMGIMLSLVLVVAGFTIFAILSMMVTEKRRDVGILSALGATPRGIQQLFLMIAFWDALVGGVLGAVIGTWGALEIDAIERWLSRTFGVQIFDRKVYLFDHIPSVVQPLWVGTIVLGAFVCALLFAAIPAWRAARLDPLEALRYE
ncbi:MAG: ABC transporter permease [Planctomycetes bacterium]|nr:ABC transporter permease [Planctomycetota bacterium]